MGKPYKITKYKVYSCVYHYNLIDKSMIVIPYLERYIKNIKGYQIAANIFDRIYY